MDWSRACRSGTGLTTTSRSPEGRAKAREYGRLGKLAQARNNPRSSAAERLEAALSEPDAWGCRHFVGGSRDRHGYGRINDDHGRTVFAHRLAYTLRYGEDSLREGESVHHLCAAFTTRSQSCCNPEHLIACSHREHMQMHALLRRESAEWAQRERQGECRNGHSRAEHGFIHSNGQLAGKLDCKACQRESDLRKLAKRRAARVEAQEAVAA